MSDIYSQYEFEDIVENEELELADEYAWNRIVNNNNDRYGRPVIEFAERWMKAMQYAIEEDGYELADVARPLSWPAGAEDISGHQYEAAMGAIGECWAYGEEFKDWRRAKYRWNG